MFTAFDGSPALATLAPRLWILLALVAAIAFAACATGAAPCAVARPLGLAAALLAAGASLIDQPATAAPVEAEPSAHRPGVPRDR